jgi:hypothetical protein
MRWVKRILGTAAILFALFYLVTQPEDAAAAVRNVVLALGRALGSIVTFFTSLAG